MRGRSPRGTPPVRRMIRSPSRRRARSSSTPVEGRTSRSPGRRGARRSPSGRRRAATRTSRQRSSSAMRRLERKIRKLERGNEEKYEWKKEGIRHQATFNNKVQDWLAEKLRTSLEDHFHGRIPADLEETIR